MDSTSEGRTSQLPLRVKPVKLRDSLYLLIPVDIARLIGAVAKSSFNLTLVEDPRAVRLVYEMKKPEGGSGETQKGPE